MATSVTSLRNPIDDLVSQLDKPPEKPLGTIESELTAQRQRGATAREIMPQTLRTGLEVTETAMRDLQARREKGAKELGELGERQAKEVMATEERFAAMRPEPIEFAPSQETAENLQNIAISMMLVGAIAGGGSKRSGIAGLKAMKGMVDGYRQGRKDIFDKEKTIFEKALETQKMKLEEIKSLYDSAIRAQTAGQTAEANKLAKQLEAELQGGAMVVDIAKGRATAAQTLLDGAIKAGDDATANKIKLDEAIEKRKLEREKMAQEAEFRRKELSLKEREVKQKEGGKQLGATDVTKIQGLDSLANSLEKQLASFKPEYASLGLFGLGAEMELEAKRRFGDALGSKYAKETVAWWSKYQQLQAPNRHALYGATLTGNELTNYRSYTAKPSDNPDVVQNFLKDQIAYSKSTAADKRASLQSAGYRVPEIVKSDFLSNYESTGKKMPEEATLKAYADKEFNGNIEEARSFLRAEGYN
jgi:hypothetical protein